MLQQLGFVGIYIVFIGAHFPDNFILYEHKKERNKNTKTPPTLKMEQA